MGWPVACLGVGRAACGTVSWRHGGKARLSVVVKATFALVPDGPMRPVTTQAVRHADRHHQDSPVKSLRAAQEAIPHRPGVDITFSGSAFAPAGRPAPAVGVRLAVFEGDDARLDKTLHVLGEAGRPFTEQVMTYELALRGDSNPTGCKAKPRVVDAKDPTRRTGGFGPISPYAKSRQRWLGGVDRKAMAAPVAELDGIDFRYFHAAPEDQWLTALRPDAWLLLDNLIRGVERCASQLPGMVGQAFLGATSERGAAAIGASEPRQWQALALRLDGVHVDGDAAEVEVTWQQSLPIGDVDPLELRVVGGVSDAALSPAWFEVDGPAPPPPSKEGFDSEATVAQEPLAVNGPALPFAPAFATAEAKPIPQQVGGGVVTFVDHSGGTVTLSPDERAAVVSPFSSEGTVGLSSTAQQEARDRTVAPFALAEGAGERRELPGAGMPWDPAAEDPVARSPVPPRTTEGVPLYTRTPLQLVVVPWQHRPPRDALTVVVKGSYALGPDGLTVPDEMAPVDGDRHVDDNPEGSLRYPSDLALFKPKADVLLVGNAYPPRDASGRRRGTAAEVQFTFGGEEGFSRRLAVLGDRSWQKAVMTLGPSAPAAFASVPLVWERAYGPSDDNPAGVGRDAREGTDGQARLPNLEDPKDLVVGPQHRAAPVCFAPISPQWPERQRKLGSYGGRWLQERWPYFPDDFRWSYYQAAPRPQQLPYLRGDEPYRLSGVHPEHALLEGRLPGVRPRVFMAVSSPGADYAFEEIVLRLDTVVFDTEALMVRLVWRGMVEVTDEHAPEVRAIYLTDERLETPLDRDAIHARFLAELAVETPADEPEGEAPGAANDTEPGKDDDLDLSAHVRATLEAAGLDPEAPPPSPPPAPGPDEIVASMRTLGLDEEVIASVEAAFAAPAEPAEPAVERSLRETVVRAQEAGASLEGADLLEAQLSRLVMTGLDLRDANLARANLEGANLMGADLRGASLTGARMKGARLEDARLDGADLSGAQAEEAVFDRASLAAVDLSDAHAPGASFRRAHGAHLRIAGSFLEGARFDEARLPMLMGSEAHLARAVFDGAELTEAVLAGVSAAGASFADAQLVDALCDEGDYTGARFDRAVATGSVWEEARLDDAVLVEAGLDDVSFVRASLERADLSGATMRTSRMKRCQARAARLIGVDLMEAQLERSDLRDADFTGANLYRAEVWKAELRGAELRDSIRIGTKLEGA